MALKDVVKHVTTAVPRGVAWFHETLKPWNGTGLPGDPRRKFKPWRDNDLVDSQGGWNFSGNWWDSIEGGSSERAYDFIAKDENGKVLLTPIESAPAYNTYSQSALNSYREFKFMFPQGIPYVVKHTIDEDDKEINFVGTRPGFDYPIKVESNQMLVVVEGAVGIVDYQEFNKNARPAVKTDEERIALVKKLVDAPMNASDKVAAILAAVTKV